MHKRGHSEKRTSYTYAGLGFSGNCNTGSVLHHASIIGISACCFARLHHCCDAFNITTNGLVITKLQCLAALLKHASKSLL